MFEQLSERLSHVVKMVRGQARLTEANIQEALRSIRVALLEADVALPVVKDLIERIRLRAVGQNVLGSLTPGQALVGVVHDVLKESMGEQHAGLNLTVTPPAVVLMVGLQGAGKTTTVAKLARLLSQDHKKKILMASCDTYRPAAIDQLRVLANQIGVDFFSPSESVLSPQNIAEQALTHAKRQFYDVLLIDTAGRLTVDDVMMDEIKNLYYLLDPVETLFVVDGMQGQDAVNTAQAFNLALPLTGVVLTKMDGDARGGAALSVRHVTGKPIKFIGMGEKVDAIEPFHPEGMASRILGMGDVLALIDDVRRHVDERETKKLADKVKKGGRFDLNDFLAQLQQMRGMGGVDKFMEKMPQELSGMTKQLDPADTDKKMRQTEGVIHAMTPKERRQPELIKASRKRRISAGSGISVQEINQILKQFEEMRKIVKMMSGGGVGKAMRTMQRFMPGLGMPKQKGRRH